jgi:hypothetical protein
MATTTTMTTTTTKAAATTTMTTMADRWPPPNEVGEMTRQRNKHNNKIGKR